MKYLILLTLLIGCGQPIVRVKNKRCKKVERVNLNEIYLVCSYRLFKRSCTRRIRSFYLDDMDFADRNCYTKYNNCIKEKLR